MLRQRPSRSGYVDHRPLSKVCQTHGVLPCPRRTVTEQGIRHCCQRGHHKVNTPHKGLGKRIAPAPAGANKRPRLQSSTLADASTLTSLTAHTASPQATETQIPNPPLPSSPVAAGDAGG